MPRRLLALAAAVLVSGCDLFTDAATRLAYDIEFATWRLGGGDGARRTLVHQTPSARGQCTGPYKVQVDKVGAIIVWCYDAAGATVSSHSTTYHSRYVDTAATVIVDKPAGAPLTLELERRAGRAVIVGVR
jgi:hypothetical protein